MTDEYKQTTFSEHIKAADHKLRAVEAAWTRPPQTKSRQNPREGEVRTKSAPTQKLLTIDSIWEKGNEFSLSTQPLV